MLLKKLKRNIERLAAPLSLNNVSIEPFNISPKEEEKMTETEEKVNELTNKLIDIINEMQKREMEDKVIVQAIKSYLAGLADGIDFAQEIRDDKVEKD